MVQRGLQFNPVSIASTLIHTRYEVIVMMIMMIIVMEPIMRSHSLQVNPISIARHYEAMMMIMVVEPMMQSYSLQVNTSSRASALIHRLMILL